MGRWQEARRRYEALPGDEADRIALQMAGFTTEPRDWDWHLAGIIAGRLFAFRDLKPGISPPLPGLLGRVSRAWFWARVHEQPDEQGVRSRGLPPPADRAEDDLYVLHPRAVRICGPRMSDGWFEREHRGDMLDVLRVPLTTRAEALEDQARRMAWQAIVRTIDPILEAVLPTVRGRYPEVAFSAFDGARSVMRFAIEHALAGSPDAERFGGLIDLMLDGNWPLGVDRRGRIEILADV